MAGMETAVRVPDGFAVGRGARWFALYGLTVATVAASTAAAVLAHAGAESQPGLTALARALMVAVPMAVGVYAWHRGADARFGLVLFAAGAGWAVTTLAETHDPAAYTVGRAAGWLVELLVVYLILCFPTGRLGERVDRRLTGAMAAVVAVFYAPQLLVAEDFSVPSPYTSCVRDCPANALFAFEREPAFVDAVMRPLGAVLVLVVMAGVLLRLYRRMRGSTPITQRMLAPVFLIAMLRAGALGVAIVGRELEPTASAIEISAWLLAIAVPAIALAFLVGLLRWRLFAGRLYSGWPSACAPCRTLRRSRGRSPRPSTTRRSRSCSRAAVRTACGSGWTAPDVPRRSRPAAGPSARSARAARWSRR